MHFNLSFLYNILINYVFNFVWLSLFDWVFDGSEQYLSNHDDDGGMQESGSEKHSYAIDFLDFPVFMCVYF